jgi:pimeloyl-ACP methyl ester carboxylesterase
MRRIVATLLIAAALATGCGASKDAPAPAALWNGCVRPAERHGFVRAADGTRIAYAETGHGTGGLVLAHGARGDLCDFIDLLRDPRLQRFRLLAFDYRGNGLSGHPSYPRSVRYRQDVAAAVAQLRSDGAHKVAVLGLSRGGPAAIAAAAQLYPTKVQAAIALASIDSLVNDNAIAAVHASRVPLLVLVNEHDGLSLAPTARAIYRASVSPDKQLVLAPGRGHGDVFRFPRVWRAFVAFLDREISR